MITVNDEDFILELFRNLFWNEKYFFDNSLSAKLIVLSIRNHFLKKNWINSSKKNDPPPDFYNKKHKLMMDVMRVDDHAFVDEKGKVQNLVLKKENDMAVEMFGKNYRHERPDFTCITVGTSGLPAKEDHNYDRYYKNFERVINKHKEKIRIYKQNHPGYKTIFFIFDESSAYCEAKDKKYFDVSANSLLEGKPHFFFFDRIFVDIIKESNTDFVIWFAPYKLIDQVTPNGVKMPKCVIFNTKKIKSNKLIDYKYDLMLSLEK